MIHVRRLFIATLATGAVGALVIPALVIGAYPISSAHAEEKGNQELDPKKRRRLNRAAAGAFVSLMPAAPDEWRAGKTVTDWRREGAQARRRYRHTEKGNEIAVSFEIRTRGLTYKKDMFDNPKKAESRGYKVVSFGSQKVLFRDSPVRREVRAWIDDRILIYMKGKADASVFEALVKSIDFGKMKEVK